MYHRFSLTLSLVAASSARIRFNRLFSPFSLLSKHRLNALLTGPLPRDQIPIQNAIHVSSTQCLGGCASQEPCTVSWSLKLCIAVIPCHFIIEIRSSVVFGMCQKSTKGFWFQDLCKTHHSIRFCEVGNKPLYFRHPIRCRRFYGSFGHSRRAHRSLMTLLTSLQHSGTVRFHYILQCCVFF